MEFAWKEYKVVLFISTVHTGALTVVTPRRRPAATSLGARQSATRLRRSGGEEARNI